MHAAPKSDEWANGNDATMLQHWVGILLDYLKTDPEVTEQDVVGLEWIYIQVLRYSQRRPRTLHRALARNPEFFAYLLKLIYLPAADSGVIEPQVEDEAKAQNLASQAFQVLRDWAHVPGGGQGLPDLDVADLAAPRFGQEFAGPFHPVLQCHRIDDALVISALFASRISPGPRNRCAKSSNWPEAAPWSRALRSASTIGAVSPFECPKTAAARSARSRSVTVVTPRLYGLTGRARLHVWTASPRPMKWTPTART